ncbi:MAG: hypothetical protein JXR70_09125 [Spirochaetales bacterium]|nr:hypothetical protein [Spirochaetales bacterium]
MQKKKELIILFISAMILLLLTACPGINSTEKKEEKKSPLEVNVTGTVQGLEAFSLQYDDHIELRWYEVEGCDGYNIYRYTDKKEEALEATLFSEIEFYDDYSANRDQVYYYRISFLKKGGESAKNPNFIAAVYSFKIDSYEPNNDVIDAIQISPGEYDGLIYSFNYGDFQDRDFYSIPPDGLYSLQIVFEEDSPLKNNLQIVYGEIRQNLNLSVNRVDFGRNITGFRIEFVSTNIDFDGVENYKILLTEN